MHELGIAASALEHALRQARGAGASRVARISLRVGTLSGADADALRFALEASLPDTPAAGARVEIETVAAAAHCRACHTEFQLDDDPWLQCPRCGGTAVDLLRGRELELSGLEVF